METTQSLVAIINSMLAERNKETISDNSLNLSLREDLGFDSMDLAELAVRIEAAFGIDVFAGYLPVDLTEILNILSGEKSG